MATTCVRAREICSSSRVWIGQACMEAKLMYAARLGDTLLAMGGPESPWHHGFENYVLGTDAVHGLCGAVRWHVAVTITAWSSAPA